MAQTERLPAPLLLLLALAGTGVAAPPAEAATSARADFDGDGYADLAVGAPQDSVGGGNRAGAVNIVFGSADGLRAAGNQQFTQDTPGVAAHASPADRFGASLAAGDIDGDGRGDLVVGVPSDDVAGRRNAGVVNVLYGSSDGLTTAGNRFVSQNSAGVIGQAERNDNFGHALAIGDFDGDGFADLAVGTRDEGLGGTTAAGAVNVIHGGAGGLDTGRTQLWHQDSPGVRATTDAFDRFGFSLAAGDLDGDGRDDLAAGVPGERIRRTAHAGAVNVLFGSPSGLTARRDQLWSQGAVGIRGAPERGDNFGRSLTIADFDGDGRGDLAAAAPFEDVGGSGDAGAVNVIYGTPGGLHAREDELWHQRSRGVDGRAQRNDRFGAVLAGGDLSRNPAAELAVGVAGEDLHGRPSAGAVNVLYGGSNGLRPAPGQAWHQGTPGVTGALERFDRLGSALTIADFGRGPAGDLAIGAPGEGHGGSDNAGAVNVLYGSIAGLDPDGDQLWHQGSAGIEGAVGSDYLGDALASGPPR